MAEATATLRAWLNTLRTRALSIGASGLVSVADRALYENFALYHKLLGGLMNFREGIIQLGASIGLALARSPGWYETLTVGLVKELDALYDYFVSKKPFAYAKDPSTIIAVNLDPNSAVEVYIDGSKISFATAPTTDSKGSVTISLPSPMSGGKHSIIVKTTNKAFYGYVVV
jgi:hypothetical protein